MLIINKISQIKWAHILLFIYIKHLVEGLGKCLSMKECLLFKHGDLSSDWQHPHKNWLGPHMHVIHVECRHEYHWGLLVRQLHCKILSISGGQVSMEYSRTPMSPSRLSTFTYRHIHMPGHKYTRSRVHYTHTKANKYLM